MPVRPCYNWLGLRDARPQSMRKLLADEASSYYYYGLAWDPAGQFLAGAQVWRQLRHCRRLSSADESRMDTWQGKCGQRGGA